MSTIARPIPVVVISGYAQRDNVFRALELGALDFIAKPRRHISPDIRNIEDELTAKIAMVRRLQTVVRELDSRPASIRQFVELLVNERDVVGSH